MLILEKEAGLVNGITSGIKTIANNPIVKGIAGGVGKALVPDSLNGMNLGFNDISHAKSALGYGLASAGNMANAITKVQPTRSAYVANRAAKIRAAFPKI